MRKNLLQEIDKFFIYTLSVWAYLEGGRFHAKQNCGVKTAKHFTIQNMFNFFSQAAYILNIIITGWFDFLQFYGITMSKKAASLLNLIEMWNDKFLSSYKSICNEKNSHNLRVISNNFFNTKNDKGGAIQTTIYLKYHWK